MALTKDQARQAVSRLLGDMVVFGIATAGTATTITDTANLVHADTNQLVGYEVYVFKGTNIGKPRIISAFDPSTDKITFATMTTLCDTTTEYEIHRKLRQADYDAVIDRALARAKIAVGNKVLSYYADQVKDDYVVAYSCYYLAMQITGSEELLTKAQIWADEKDRLLSLLLYLSGEEIRFAEGE